MCISLFILYCNDLTQAIHQSKVKQYANDTTMSLVSSDVNGLEEGLEDVVGVEIT